MNLGPRPRRPAKREPCRASESMDARSRVREGTTTTMTRLASRALIGLALLAWALPARAQGELGLDIVQPKDGTDLAELDVPLGKVPVLLAYDSADAPESLEFWVDGQLAATLSVDDLDAAAYLPPDGRGDPRRWLRFEWSAADLGSGAHTVAFVLASGGETIRQEAKIRIGGVPTAPPSAEAELRFVNPVSQQVLRDRVILEVEVTNGQASWVGFFLDKRHIGAAFATPFKCVFDTALQPDGVHILQASARLRDGSVRESAPIRVTFANAGNPLGATPGATGAGGAGTSSARPGFVTPPAVGGGAAAEVDETPEPLPLPVLTKLPGPVVPSSDLAGAPLAAGGGSTAPLGPGRTADSGGWAPLPDVPAQPEIVGPESGVPPTPAEPLLPAPTLPVEPVEPTEPVQPAIPDEPVQPAEPPVGPLLPGGPGIEGPSLPEAHAPRVIDPPPVEPVAPEPIGPDPTEPVEVIAEDPQPPAPAGPEIAGPIEESDWHPIAIDPQAPPEPTEPTGPDQPAEPAEPTEPTEPAPSAPAGHVTVELDGEVLTLDDPAVVTERGTVMVPLKPFLERLGCETKWDADGKRVRAYRGLKLLLSVQAGAGEILAGGRPVSVSPAPDLRGEVLYAPLLVLTEGLGYGVELDESTATVRLSTPK